MPSGDWPDSKDSLLGRIVDLFLRGHLAPPLIVTSLIAGVSAIYLTLREEEPQVVVPMADVIVSAPGLPVGDILGFAPPLCLTKAEADRIVDATRGAVDDVAKEL